ncbi:MAG: transcription antitermination factor NusB [Clostridia bacterium]|nr:transcription antitermination factor NusB [Clostridia bacterium]
MKQMSRRDARIKAYELIFMINTCEDVTSELERLAAELKDHKKHVKYISDVVNAAYNNRAEIDRIISENISESWSISRLSKMCVATLRLAIAEMLYVEDIPESVSINEAVELSKIYGDENESGFVNGLLGKLAK